MTQPPVSGGTLLGSLKKILGTPNLESSQVAALLAGPPDSGKSVFCKQLTHEYLEMGRGVVYAVTDNSPAQTLVAMKQFGWDLQRALETGLQFVDLYSWRLDGQTELAKGAYGFKANPSNPVDIQISIREVAKHLDAGHPLRIILLDSLTAITKLVGEERAAHLVQLLTARMREAGFGVATLDSGACSKNFEALMNAYHDVVIELRTEGRSNPQRSLRVTRLQKGSYLDEWIPFTITHNGIGVS